MRVICHVRLGRSLVRHQIADQTSERFAQVLPFDDHIEHAVIEEIFGALEAFGELFADRILNDALSRKADQRIGSAICTSPSIA